MLHTNDGLSSRLVENCNDIHSSDESCFKSLHIDVLGSMPKWLN